MDLVWLEEQRECERESEYQLLLLQHTPERKGEVCRYVCVCAQRSVGFKLCSSCSLSEMRWQPSDRGPKLLAGLDASLKQSRAAFQTSVSTPRELSW